MRNKTKKYSANLERKKKTINIKQTSSLAGFVEDLSSLAKMDGFIFEVASERIRFLSGFFCLFNGAGRTQPHRGQIVLMCPRHAEPMEGGKLLGFRPSKKLPKKPS